MDVARQQDLQNQIAARVAESMADVDWAEATLFLLQVGDVSRTWVDALDAAGSAKQDLATPDVAALGTQLREAMADPERGTWFSLVLTLSSDGSFTARFNGERRVFDDAASPFEATGDDVVPSDADYAADLERFPRAEKYRPEWLPEGVTPAAPTAPTASGSPAAPAATTTPAAILPASLAGLADRWGWPGVLASIAQQTAASPVASSPEATPADESDAPELTLGHVALRVRDAVVLDVIAPHRVATLLRLHAEAVDAGVLPAVDAVESVDPELGLEEARVASPEVVPAVEAAVAGVIDAIVAEHLRAVLT
ncbi:hypothetical protein ES689_01765 [Frigoribacterium sp. ACAM 257]|uniref:hypothetical protein n=1 Tax=Frigoribacterium sp. ACAM 257 TaxID=2508998 RepID=UPI0011B9A9A4|nr:hypothetical protein [Frigoribacterium sp. ACAM 257]TWX40221.1 hypothetical protein ES689_01765 [Frigoribacterium sp. ACAM 257]